MKRAVKTKIQNYQIGYSIIIFESEVYGNEILDTKVIINDQLLCVIAGDEISLFKERFEKLIKDFKI